MQQHRSPYGVIGRRQFSVMALLGLLVVVGLLLAACAPGAAWRPTSLVSPVSTATPDAEGLVAAGQITPEATGAPSPAPSATLAVEPTGTTAASTTYPPAQFAGIVTAMPRTGWEGVWQVAGRVVNVTPSTSVDQRQGPAQPGAQVAVEGWQHPDGSIDAGWIIVLNQNAATPTPTGDQSGASTPAPTVSATAVAGGQPQVMGAAELCGQVEQLPASGIVGDWRVAGRIVHVSRATRAPGQLRKFAVGELARVSGWLQPDGSLNAGQIKVQQVGSNGACQPGLRAGQSGETNDTENQNNDQGQGDDQGSSDKNQNEGQQQSPWEGAVDRLPANGLVGTWIISGRQVVVDADTRVTASSKKAGKLGIGTDVQVIGRVASDGSYHATKIIIKVSNGANGNGNNGDGNNGNGKNGNGKGKGGD